MNNSPSRGLVWIRRDLRLYDHHALSLATQQFKYVQILFNFDTDILSKLDSPQEDARVLFIRDSLLDLASLLKQKNPQASLLISYGPAIDEIPFWCKKLNIQHVFSNEDYEPYAKVRDEAVRTRLQKMGIQFTQLKDQVIFRSQEVLSKDGNPFKVFTPYKNTWIKRINLEINHRLVNHAIQTDHLASFTTETHEFWEDLKKISHPLPLPAGTQGATTLWKIFEKKLPHYHLKRDLIAIDGTSLLSVHLRFGTVSIRHLLRKLWEREDFALPGIQTWLSELIWREFYQGILDLNPHVQSGSYKKQYDAIQWKGTQEHFDKWCLGMTGYPIIDAGMRMLNQTGMMPNRLRMIVATFLCKTLLVDWKKGEQYFAKKLLDFDLSANNGGWQWCASTGTDAQPYFRIFNPHTQSEKFDPEASFIKKFCPELEKQSPQEIHQIKNLPPSYPTKIVVYESQRAKALSMYKDL